MANAEPGDQGWQLLMTTADRLNVRQLILGKLSGTSNDIPASSLSVVPDLTHMDFCCLLQSITRRLRKKRSGRRRFPLNKSLSRKEIRDRNTYARSRTDSRRLGNGEAYRRKAILPARRWSRHVQRPWVPPLRGHCLSNRQRNNLSANNNSSRLCCSDNNSNNALNSNELNSSRYRRCKRSCLRTPI